MLKQGPSTGVKTAMLSLVALGVATLAASTFLMSSFFAIVGFSLIFWGAVLLYITPTGSALLDLINAAAEPTSANIERILTEYNLNQQGIYLPSDNNVGLFNKSKPLDRSKSVVVFFPETQNLMLNSKRAQVRINGGLFVTPPGRALCRVFEQRIGRSFSTIDLEKFTKIMPIILTKHLNLAETVEIQTEEEIVTIEITMNVLARICQETSNKPKTHKQVGCLLSSAIACALAKVTGKPITLQNEISDAETKATKIQYQIMANMKD